MSTNFNTSSKNAAQNILIVASNITGLDLIGA